MPKKGRRTRKTNINISQILSHLHITPSNNNKMESPKSLSSKAGTANLPISAATVSVNSATPAIATSTPLPPHTPMEIEIISNNTLVEKSNHLSGDVSSNPIPVLVGVVANVTDDLETTVLDGPPPPPEDEYECLTPTATQTEQQLSPNNDFIEILNPPPPPSEPKTTLELDDTPQLISRVRVNSKGRIIKLPLTGRKGEPLAWKHMAVKTKIKPIPLNALPHRSYVKDKN